MYGEKLSGRATDPYDTRKDRGIYGKKERRRKLKPVPLPQYAPRKSQLA